MRAFFALLFLLAAGIATAADQPTIRSFPISTLESLGRELFVRDAMAAAAFDAMLASHPEAGKLPIRGWITQFDKENRRVYLIQEKEAKLSLAYVVSFAEPDPPKVEEGRGAELPDFVAKRYAARRAATAAIPKFMTKTYNFEVLDAPDGKGFLVYALAATKDPNEVVVGGHYRVSVSAEGKVEQVDALSRSFLVLKKNGPEVPKDNQLAGLTMSHIVSKTPVETHVYLSLVHKLPFYVITMDRVAWKVEDGKITQLNDPKEGK